MNRIEVVFQNKEIGEGLRKEFVGIANVEFIERIKKEQPPAEESLEGYLSRPMPAGAGPDQLLTLQDFILAFVLNGSYDLLKVTLFKAVSSAWNVIKEITPGGIKVFTGDFSSRWRPLPRPYRITFSLPYLDDRTKLETLVGDIKNLDMSIKKFLNTSGGKLRNSNFEFEYKDGLWQMVVK